MTTLTESFENGIFTGLLNDVADLDKMPDEYRIAVGKIVSSHVVNELTGAERFDEPAIEFAPTPKDKWLSCRIAMEEYGHHVKFYRLAVDMNLDPATLDHHNGKHLSVFEYPVQNWNEFIVFKAVCDLAEIIQVEDLAECTFVPLRKLAIETMPEERFHAGFGRSGLKELCATAEGQIFAQDAVNRFYPNILPFFGSRNSKNNEIYRKWGIKKRTNGEMQDEYTRRVRAVVEEVGLTLPEISQ
jgi:ring-1,2-phenylacetyl-CoA epoxidase subunit PaaA